MVSEKHKAAANQIGARRVEAPDRGQLPVHRQRRQRLIADGLREFAQNQASGAHDPGARQVERGEVGGAQFREPDLATFDDPELPLTLPSLMRWVPPSPRCRGERGKGSSTLPPPACGERVGVRGGIVLP